MPNGPSLNDPASRSSSDPNTLGESKLGTQSQSSDPSGATSAPVWQFDRKADSAIGGNADGAAALCGTDADSFSTGLPLPVAGLGSTVLMRPFDRVAGPERRVCAGEAPAASSDASEIRGTGRAERVLQAAPSSTATGPSTRCRVRGSVRAWADRGRRSRAAGTRPALTRQQRPKRPYPRA